nr:hypothetical protein [uncultured Flavobacterium sp.]
MNEVNDFINLNLNIIYSSKEKKMFSTNFLDVNGKKLTQIEKGLQFQIYLESEGLITTNKSLCTITPKGIKISENGGWIKYLIDTEKNIAEIENKKQIKENLEVENLKLQKEASEYQKSIRDKEYQIRNLTSDNLRLGNWDIRFRWYIAIGGFIGGFVTKYFIGK